MSVGSLTLGPRPPGTAQYLETYSQDKVTDHTSPQIDYMAWKPDNPTRSCPISVQLGSSVGSRSTDKLREGLGPRGKHEEAAEKHRTARGPAWRT